MRHRPKPRKNHPKRDDLRRTGNPHQFDHGMRDAGGFGSRARSPQHIFSHFDTCGLNING
jgi:hypothetical protein